MSPDFEGSIQEQKPLYYMYRGLSRPQDAASFEAWKVRFDVTVIPAARLGPEFVKTAGHYHPEAEAGLTYPELYEVLVGQAHFLLQKPNDAGVSDVLLVDAHRGEKLLIPPNYGHVAINPGAETLVMANLVSSRFESLYEPYRVKCGAAYYELADGRLIPNPRYGVLPPLRKARARDQESRLPNVNIYRLFVEAPDSTAFLNKPSRLSAMRLTLDQLP
ncbi:MAG: glucose-6-phosphate isomerase family protein [Candidatus Bathyarchaeia archaeon]